MIENTSIVKCILNGEEYIFWRRAEYVKDYIDQYLRQRFCGKLVIRELNQIDFTIPEENIPIEVQSTPIDSTTNLPSYSHFETSIEKQIRQNISMYDICYFFFDSELLRAMKSRLSRSNVSVNMDWFRKFMKEKKLIVFIVRYDGIINEIKYNDFDFLSTLSRTCNIAAETDDVILDKNKLKIFANVVRGYSFTQVEIDTFRNDWRKYCEQNKLDEIEKNDSFSRFLTKHEHNRYRLYGSILGGIGYLPSINDILRLKYRDRFGKYFGSVLGIFSIKGYGKTSVIRFVDEFNVCQYFPGYMRNKEAWNKLKGLSLNSRQFYNVSAGKNDVLRGIEYAWEYGRN